MDNKKVRRVAIAIIAFLTAVIVLIFIFGALAKADEAVLAPGAIKNSLAPSECIPLTDGTVPNENDGIWMHRSDVSGFTEFERKDFYRSETGMTLAVYSYFGKVAWKAWSCGGDRTDHMIAVARSDGSWNVGLAQWPDSITVTQSHLVSSSIRVDFPHLVPDEITVVFQGETHVFK